MSFHDIRAFIRQRSPQRDAHNRVLSSTAIEDVSLRTYFADVCSGIGASMMGAVVMVLDQAPGTKVSVIHNAWAATLAFQGQRNYRPHHHADTWPYRPCSHAARHNAAQ